MDDMVASIQIVLLILSPFATNAKIDNNPIKLRRRCEQQMENCSIKKECFLDLLVTDNYNFIKECSRVIISSRKSYYREDMLSFSIPSTSLRKGEFPKNRTFSVYLSENDGAGGDNPALVRGCCNLREKDKCAMPATFDKSKTFYVLFPYVTNGNGEIYCYYKIYYDDAPIEMCVEEKDIDDQCLVYKEGDFWIRLKYTPLDKHSDTLKLHRCYFTLPSELLPRNMTTRRNGYIEIGGKYIVAKRPSRGEKSALVTVGKNAIQRNCQYYENVNGSEHTKLCKKTYNPANGNLICFLAKRPFDDNGFYDKVYCEHPQNILSIYPWQIAVLISSLVLLLLLLAFGKVFRTYHRKSMMPSATLATTNMDDTFLIMSISSTKGGEEIDQISVGMSDDNGDSNDMDSYHEDAASITLINHEAVYETKLESRYIGKSIQETQFDDINSNSIESGYIQKCVFVMESADE